MTSIFLASCDDEALVNGDEELELVEGDEDDELELPLPKNDI